MKGQSGIYQLVYKPTKQFYIGGTRDIYKRWHSHKSHFKAGRNHKSLQNLYDITGSMNDWKIEILELCDIKDVNTKEQEYIDKHKHNKKCLNTYHKIFSGRRDVKINKQGREHLAISLLGKNTTDGILRPNNLTFVSPQGKEYPNIISVKRFAEEHGLSQSQMNNLANGKTDSHCGWTVRGANLPYAVNVQEYWSRERMLQNYPEHIIVGPDGKKYKTFVLYHFELEHGCTVNTKDFALKGGLKSSFIGLDHYGRGYRLINTPYFKVTHNGKVYNNVISLGKWAEGVGLTQKQFAYHFRTMNDVKRSNIKAIKFKIEKITPPE